MNWTLARLLVFRQIRVSPLRSVLMLLGIALGVSLYTAISLINRSTLASFRESVDAVVGKASLTVSGGETGFLEKTLDELSKIREIRHAVPMTENQTYYEGRDGKYDALQIMGIDLLKETSVRTYRTDDEQIIEDPLVFLNQPDSVILTKEFAARHGLKADDRIKLTTAYGIKNLTVRGLLSPSGPAKAYGGSIGIMDIDGARVTFGKEGRLDRVDLVLRENVDAQSIAPRIQKAIGNGLTVLPPETQSENLTRMVSSFQGMLSFLSLLALLVGLFLVFNSVSVSVAERRREIGTVRALGGRRRLVLMLVLLESSIIGFLSSFLGYVLGKGLAQLLLHNVVTGMSNQFTTTIQVTQIQSGPGDVWRACVAGTLTTALAALLPAWKATRITAVEALKPKGIGEASTTAPGKLDIGRARAWFGAAALVYLLIFALLGLGKKYTAIEGLHPPLSVLAAAFVAPPLVIGMIRLIRRFCADDRGLILKIAMENLLRSPRRTSSNVLSLIVGLMLVITIAAVNVSFRQTLVGWADTMGAAGDMLVSQNGRVVQLQVQPLHESLVRELNALTGMAHTADRFARGLRYFKVQFEGLNLAVKAFDPPPAPGAHFKFIDALDLPAREQGSALFYSNEPRVLVSENLVKKLGRGTGSSLDLPTPSGTVTFKIMGVLRDFASPDGVLYMNRDVYKRYWKDSLVTAVAASSADGVSPIELKRQVESTLGRNYGIIAVLNTELIAQLIQTVDEGFLFNYAIQIAALLVGLVGLMNTMLISVIERTREIGLYRAVGMSRAQLSQMILLECFFQGTLGALIAVLLGGYISYVWIIGTLSNLLGWVIRFFFPLEAVWQVFFAGVLVALLAGLIPAWRASKLEIRSALDYE